MNNRVIILDTENRYTKELEAIFDNNNRGYVRDRAAISGPMKKLVCLQDEFPVGYAILYEGADFCEQEGYPVSPDAAEDAVYIWQVVVDASQMSRGVGSLLLQEVTKRFGERERYLCVDEENAIACHCYEKAGYEPVIDFHKESHGEMIHYTIRKCRI